MRKPLLIGLPALVLATSCVPQHRPEPARSVAHAEPRPATLLRELALDVPDDLTADLHRGMPAPASGAPPFLAAPRSADDADRALECLTEAVYYEARSEPVDGQRAVAQVVLNRVRDRAFPRSVCGVVYQGSTRSTGCQFSFTCDGSMAAPREERAWQRARDIAAAALAGSVYEPVGSATFYHAAYVSPWWAGSMARIGAIGAHIFYRWRGAMENALAFRQSYAGVEPDKPMRLPAGAVQSLAGAFGEEQVGTVTIHRGGANPHASHPNAAYTHIGGSFGVTVHRGAMPLADDAETASAADPGKGAI